MKVPASRGARWSVVHAGSAKGWVAGAEFIRLGTKHGDFHGNFDHELFEHWIQQSLIPNLPRHCYIIMDNASYHHFSEITLSHMNKSSLMEYMDHPSHRVEFAPDASLKELQTLMRESGYPLPRVEEWIIAAGHAMIWLPPYTPQLNGIEKAWAIMKKPLKVGDDAIEFASSDFEDRIRESIQHVTPRQWARIVRHVWNEVEQFATEFGIGTNGLMLDPDEERAIQLAREEKARLLAERKARCSESKRARVAGGLGLGEDRSGSSDDDEVPEVLVPTRSGRTRLPPVKLLDASAQAARHLQTLTAPAAVTYPANIFPTS